VPQQFFSPQVAFQQQAALAAAYPQMYPTPFFGAPPYFDASSGYYSALANMSYQQQQQQFVQFWPHQVQEAQRPTPDGGPPPEPPASPPPPPNSPPPALPPTPAPPLDPSLEPIASVDASSSTPTVAAATRAVVYKSTSTRLVRKLPLKRPSALDLDQPATASTLSPASELAAAYVPFFSSDRAVRQLVADQPRRLVIDISDDEDESDDDASRPPAADSRIKLSTLAPTARAKSTTPSLDSLQAKEDEIQRMMAMIAAMEKRQKARSPSAQPSSKAASPVLSTTATPLPEPAPSSSASLLLPSAPASVPATPSAQGGDA
jgi:hypothetical protein